MNNLLTMIPTTEDIYDAVKSLNKFIAPGLDVFGGVFYHMYWGIIEEEVCNTVNNSLTQVGFFRTTILVR